MIVPASPRLDDDAGGATSWTDPSLVARLAEDCRWAPAWLDQSLGEGQSRHPLSCTLEIVQSCFPDLCFEEDEDTCKPRCVTACGACNAGCATSCETCKSTCTDARCKQTCAERCGACRDDCLRAEDRCRTGTCGAAVAACNKKLKADWKKSTCAKVCPRVRECGHNCWGEKDPEPCVERCKARLMTGCPDQFYSYCMFDASP